MNRQLYQWISQLVRDKPDQITSRPLSLIGQQVQAHYHSGHVRNNRLIFSAEDKRRLRQQILNEIGLDPFVVEQLPENRLEMAKYHANEKLANKPVSHDHLLLNSPDGVIRLNEKNIQLHPELIPTAGLFCLNSGIGSIEHDAIVVVENLAMMQVCGECNLPSFARQALWVYRGDHKSGAKVNTCHDFVSRLGTNKDVIIFSDMDPKGLEIALTIPCANFWLGPVENLWQAVLKSRNASRSGFDDQSEAMAYLLKLLDSNSLSLPFMKLISLLHDERSSFRQEHAYSSNAVLELFPIKAKDYSRM